ncbi:type I polyketide synthase [Actinomadura chibensis]|uniref:Type I polyketide synthase n=1 Tax=Actinomadura chibensis TaxID=392828 RepID=A0A5D0NQC3_9ACTN|nr:type I polyketide synthase [Actinomadura chibensis]TYB46394.1 type I polyketide synthase [Actinomadura chibensis]
MRKDGACGAGSEPVAVVAMGCRFPQANGIEDYWRLLVDNVDAVTAVPPTRYEVQDLYDPVPGTLGRTVSREGGFIDDPFHFDAGFFGISPVEAQETDPQQRVLLQVVWEALEEAGIRPSTLAGSSTGVFVGQATAEYAETTQNPRSPEIRHTTGSRLRGVTAGRVSYAFDLRGPSVVVDTACSSSLMAVHMARQSLLSGECDLAIAAGVNLLFSATDGLAYSHGEMLAANSRCKFGDAAADGFVRSDGIGVVVLQRLSDAARADHPVLAVIRGSAVVNDGRGSGLLLRPAVDGQTSMLRDACRNAGVEPRRLDYVEAHGTGTRVGDGVELRALAEALGTDRPADRPLPVGSVKTNIGHTEAAAGIAGLIKVVLAGRHRLLPASLHVSTPNALLSEGSQPVRLVRENTPLPAGGEEPVLGVSSFGISGTNVHVIVEGAGPAPSAADVPSRSEGPDGDEPQVLVLSARSPKALRMLAGVYAEYLSPGGRGRDYPLRAICRSAALHRDHHPYRAWAVGRTHDEVAATLRSLAEGTETPDGGFGSPGFDGPARTVFVFPGQGSQWLGMGRQLLDESPAFQKALAACDETVVQELGWSVIERLTADEELPDDVEVVQPILWAMEVALTAVWRELGVAPDVCIGHSMGEAAAAYAAGMLPLADSAAVICRRSGLMSRLAGRGGLLLVGLSADDARARAARHGGSLHVAALNSPSMTVLAGDTPSLTAFARECEEEGVLARRVRANVASHSPLMDALRGDLLEALRDVQASPSGTELLSTVRCAPLSADELGPEYWVDNLRCPVRFTDAVRRAGASRAVFVEISPHPILTAAMKETLADAGFPETVVPTLTRDGDERWAMARSLGAIFAHGGEVDWVRHHPGREPYTPLPTYAWDAQPYRRESAPAAVAPGAQSRDIELAAEDREGRLGGLRWHGVRVVPPTRYFTAALETARSVSGGGTFELKDVRLGDRPIEAGDGGPATLRVTVGPPTAGESRGVTVEALGDGRERTSLCMSGDLRPVVEPSERDAHVLLNSVLGRCADSLSADEFRAVTASHGVEAEQAPAGRVWRRDGEAVAWMTLPDDLPRASALEFGLQLIYAALPDGRPCVPTSFDRITLHDEARDVWALARVMPERRSDRMRADVFLLAPDGRVLAEFVGITLLRGGASRKPVMDSLSSAVGRARHLAQRLGKTVAGDVRHARPAPWEPAVAEIRPLRAAPPTPRTPHTPRTPRTPETAPVRQLDSLRKAFLTHAASVLGIPATMIDGRRRLRDLGMDSLMAVDLNRRLAREFNGVNVGTAPLLSGDSVRDLAESFARMCLAESTPAA